MNIKADFKILARDVEKLTSLFSQHVVHAAIIELLAQAKSVDADVLADIASKGTNVPADLKTLQDAASFFVYFEQSFLPSIQHAYRDKDK